MFIGHPILDEIRRGIQLRPTRTIDKSSPMFLLENEKLSDIVRPVLKEKQHSSNTENNARSAIPNPPPLLLANKPRKHCTSPALLKLGGNQPVDRELLMNSIRQGVKLRKCVINDKSEPIINAESLSNIKRSSSVNHLDESRCFAEQNFSNSMGNLSSTSIYTSKEEKNIPQPPSIQPKYTKIERNKPFVKKFADNAVVDRDALLRSIRAGVNLRKVPIDDDCSSGLRNYLCIDGAVNAIFEDSGPLGNDVSNYMSGGSSSVQPLIVADCLSDFSHEIPKKADERYTSPIPTREMIEAEIPTGSAVNRIKLLNSLQNSDHIQTAKPVQSGYGSNTIKYRSSHNDPYFLASSTPVTHKAVPWINLPSTNKSSNSSIKMMAQKFNQNACDDRKDVKNQKFRLPTYFKFSDDSQEVLSRKKFGDDYATMKTIGNHQSAPHTIRNAQSWNRMPCSQSLTASQLNYPIANRSEGDAVSEKKVDACKLKVPKNCPRKFNNDGIGAIPCNSQVHLPKAQSYDGISFATPIQIITENELPTPVTSLESQRLQSSDQSFNQRVSQRRNHQSLSPARFGSGTYPFAKMSESTGDSALETTSSDQSFYSPIHSSQSNITTQSSYHSPTSDDSMSPSTSKNCDTSNFLRQPDSSRSTSKACGTISGHILTSDVRSAASSIRAKQCSTPDHNSLEKRQTNDCNSDSHAERQPSSLDNSVKRSVHSVPINAPWYKPWNNTVTSNTDCKSIRRKGSIGHAAVGQQGIGRARKVIVGFNDTNEVERLSADNPELLQKNFRFNIDLNNEQSLTLVQR